MGVQNLGFKFLLCLVSMRKVCVYFISLVRFPEVSPCFSSLEVLWGSCRHERVEPWDSP